jgi:hypothetical protein
VASEKGTAQTVGIYLGGVVGHRYEISNDKRIFWKEEPKKVIALYLKSSETLDVS